MQAIADYKGNMISHLELLYRPGDRELATELAEALGCKVWDTGFMGDTGETYLAIHPNADDPDIENNVLFIAEMAPEQLAVEDSLASHTAGDPALSERLATFRDKVRQRPFGIAHIALRCRSPDEIVAAMARLERASPKLRERVELRTFWPEDDDAATTYVQGFVYQDVIVSGSFLLGQLIELQSSATAVPVAAKDLG